MDDDDDDDNAAGSRSNHISILVTEESEVYGLMGTRGKRRELRFDGKKITDPATGKYLHLP